MCESISSQTTLAERRASLRYKKTHASDKSMIDENEINDENKPVEDVSQMPVDDVADEGEATLEQDSNRW